jgi:hypothetical protein
VDNLQEPTLTCERFRECGKMAQLPGRDVILAGRTLPRIASAFYRGTPIDDSPLQPKRSEETVEFELASISC